MTQNKIEASIAAGEQLPSEKFNVAGWGDDDSILDAVECERFTSIMFKELPTMIIRAEEPDDEFTLEAMQFLAISANARTEVKEMYAEVQRLRERLELSDKYPYDGIEARDATIGLLELALEKQADDLNKGDENNG